MTSQEDDFIVNDSDTKNKSDYKPLFDIQPDDNATKEEWCNWAILLRDWAIKISKAEKGRKKQLKKLRKNINTKDKAFVDQKKRIEELENDNILNQIRKLFSQVASGSIETDQTNSKQAKLTANDSNPKNKFAYKPLFEMQPDDNSTKEEWHNWAISLRDWATKKSKTEKDRRKKLKKLGKELYEKKQVFAHYQEKIKKLEEQNFLVTHRDLFYNIASRWKEIKDKIAKYKKSF